MQNLEYAFAGVHTMLLAVNTDLKPPLAQLDQRVAIEKQELNFPDQITENTFLEQVTSAVRIMETYMDFVTTSSTLFRDLGGLTQMIGRLDRESQTSMEAPAQPPPTYPPSGSIALPQRNLIKFLLRAIALASYSPGSGARPQVT